jgi:hypothetical protein
MWFLTILIIGLSARFVSYLLGKVSIKFSPDRVGEEEFEKYQNQWKD